MVYRAGVQYVWAQVPEGLNPQPVGPTLVTPQPEAGAPSPIPVAQPSPTPIPQVQPEPKAGTPKIIPFIAIVVVFALLAIAFVYIKVIPHPTTTTSLSTTTISNLGEAPITGCTNINAPGGYYFASNISTKIQSGACINITASNVKIDCQGHQLIGYGPFVGVPPFTSGIKISSDFVTLTNCKVSRFSYGVFAGPASGLVIDNNNISSNYVLELYLDNVQNSSIYQNIMEGASGEQGVIQITNSTSNNIIYNNTITGGVNYGIVINSSGNIFNNNFVRSGTYSFYCTSTNGFPESSSGTGNNCYNDSGCSFLTCAGVNLPVNLSSIILSSSVSSCGSISTPGVYTMEGPLDMNNFINTSNPYAYAGTVACISIKSGGVTLNCGGYPITHALTGILATRRDNITISNCSVSANNYGIIFTNVSDSKIYNSSTTGGFAGIALDYSDADFLTNVTDNQSGYGIFIENSTTDSFKQFKDDNNTYGIYLTNSTGDIFTDGQAIGNSNIDVYASPDSANSNYNLMTTTRCGLTNAAWASCQNHITTSLQYTAITSCGQISRPGNYLLTSPISTTSQSCIGISASNVRFDCNDQFITSSIAEQFGYAISISNATNVTVQNCRLSFFGSGIAASNSRGINVNNITDAFSVNGIEFSRVVNSIITASSFLNNTYFGIAILNSSNDIVSDTNASYEIGPGAGVLLNSSRDNLLSGVVGYSDDYGLVLQGNSQNNTIENNTMSGSSVFDYLCSPESSSIDSEYGGINGGATKDGCRWLVVLPPGYSGMQCLSIVRPAYIGITTDQEYTVGATCYTVLANQTVINCNGHTIIAVSNGTFVQADPGSTLTVSNCLLKGFSQLVSSEGASVVLTNDTVYSNPEGAMQYLPEVSIVGGTSVKLSSDNITTAYNGISVSDDTYGTVEDNRVSAGGVAYAFINTTSLDLKNNLATLASGVLGLLMVNSTQNLFQSNNFTAVTGMECYGSSSKNSSNTDQGENICTVQLGCSWIKSSSGICT